MTELDLEEKILSSLSSINSKNIGGLWGEDSTEESDDKMIIRCVVNPIQTVDNRIKKSTVEIILAVRKECDIEGTIFSNASKELLEMVNGWENNYKKSVDELSCSTFIPTPQYIVGSDGKLEITSSPVNNLNTSAEYDATNNASILKCSFDLYGIESTVIEESTVIDEPEVEEPTESNN